MASQFQNDDVKRLNNSLMIDRNDLVNRWGNVISSYQALPGLVGFWPMSSVQRSTGNAYDLSGQGRTLTYNGNPIYNIQGIAPFIFLDGTGDYLSRADETDLDILGTEAIYAAATRGVTLGGWYLFGSLAAAGGMIGKLNATGNQRSYSIFTTPTAARFQVSSNGTLTTNVDHTTLLATNTWYFIAARYTPSTELAIWLNDSKVINTTSIPAALFNSTAIFEIGGVNGGANTINARASLCFLCANALPDSLVTALFEQTRVLFGV